jgi:hypothetical protein
MQRINPELSTCYTGAPSLSYTVSPISTFLGSCPFIKKHIKVFNENLKTNDFF